VLPYNSLPACQSRPAPVSAPYEIVTLIGAGGMGEVYKARDTRLNRTVAIKVLPARYRGDLDRRRRLEREAQVIATLAHPHICTLNDVGQYEDGDFLVCSISRERRLRVDYSGDGLRLINFSAMGQRSPMRSIRPTAKVLHIAI
jgi:serine/threonine protein kinase